jgi:hypothetical protein
VNNITVSIELEIERVAHLLSCAFESGDVGYWCRIGKTRGNTARNRKRAGVLAEHHDPAVWLPLVSGAGVEIIDHNESDDPKDWAAPVMLDLAAVRRGLALMADPKNGHTHHFGNWLREGEDMTTGDVFLQFCVLGEVKYG